MEAGMRSWEPELPEPVFLLEENVIEQYCALSLRAFENEVFCCLFWADTCGQQLVQLTESNCGTS